MRRHRSRWIIPALCALALLATSCSKPRPIVAERHYHAAADAKQRIAVVPFVPGPRLGGERKVKDESGWAAAALVTRFVTEAMTTQGLAAIPASEIEAAFLAEGTVIPRSDPRANAIRAHASFGATSVLLGRVLRYRERSGEALGSEYPASAAFTVTLYSAPEGRRLWSATFDETQPSISADVLRARFYPGRGTRWLSVAELSQFGATEISKLLAGWP